MPVTSYPTPFAERARKFVVAVVGLAATVGAAIGTGDFSTVGGVVTGVVALLTAFGVYAAPNAPQR